jgi:signal transduction histidine kinase
MAWSEHIHLHVHNDETNSLLREIRDILKENDNGGKVKELETQMDNWLLALKQNIDKLKTVSDTA